MSDVDAAEAERLFSKNGFKPSHRAVASAIQAIRESDSRLLLSRLGELGIPLGSLLGQSLQRLCRP